MSEPVNAELFNPFPGLRPFREDEEHLFFGRESQIDAMVDKLSKTRFLVVVGTSGSGKSSLVNCGLRPALHRGLMAKAGTSWKMAQFRPGSNPIRAMAGALASEHVLFGDYQPEGVLLVDIVEATLRMSKFGLADIGEQAQLGEDMKLLVVVDQFEELFRYCKVKGTSVSEEPDQTQETMAFVKLLFEAQAQANIPIYIVLTMRSDFLGDCAQFPGLAEAINGGQYLVPRLTRDERRAAILGPVGVGGGEISPVLLTRLVNDVGDNPDQLSILQHALNRTWAGWQNECQGEEQLSLSHYEAIGTMAHALDQHAEKAYAELGNERQQKICERIFKALTDLGTDARGIRRPTSLAILCALASASTAEVTKVIDIFRKPSRSFLMPPFGEILEPETVIDISHESLMRVWERLKIWAGEEAHSAQRYRRLLETAAEHLAGKTGLLRDPELQLSLDWRKSAEPNEVWANLYGGDFDAVIRFLAESEKECAEEKRQQEEGQKRELEQAQALAEERAKSARRSKNWLVVACIFAVAAAGAAYLAIKAWGAAQALERDFNARALVAQAATLLDSREADPGLALLLGFEAGTKADITEVRSLLVTAGQYSWPTAVLAKKDLHTEASVVSLSADGTRLAVLAGDQLSLWDVSTPEPRRKWTHPKPIKSSSFMFSPDQQQLAVALEASIELLDTLTGNVTQRFTFRENTEKRKLFFSLNGKWLASVQGNEIHILDYHRFNHGLDPVPQIAKTESEVVLLAFEEKEKIFIAHQTPLAAFAFELQADGVWKKNEVKFSKCMKPSSVAVSPNYVSATWPAKTCTFDGQEEKWSFRGPPLFDVILSPHGSAFAKIADGDDIIVGVGDPTTNGPESRIKGAIPKGGDDGDLTRSISLSEDGTRAVVIGWDHLVKIYSISYRKPMLSSINSESRHLFTVEPMGRWMALVRPTAKSEPHEVLDIVPLELRTNSDRPPVDQRSIKLPARPSKICASQDSVTAVLPSTTTGPVWVTYDVVTGKEIRFEPKTEGTIPMDCIDKASRPPADDISKTSKVAPTSQKEPVNGAKGMVANPWHGYKIYWTNDKNDGFKATSVSSADPSLPYKYNVADNRWLAYWDLDKNRLDLLDLQQGKVIWEFKADKEMMVDKEMMNVEFEAHNSLLKVTFTSKTNVSSEKNVMLIPVDIGLLQRYVKWLVVPRELTHSERCKYAFGGKECFADAAEP